MKSRTDAQSLGISGIAFLAVFLLNGGLAVAGPVSGSFMSQNWNRSGTTDYPTVPFGGLRLWDTGTTWLDLETSSNHFNWAPLDTWLGQATNHDVLYTFGKVPLWLSTNGGFNSVPRDFNTGNNAWKQFVTNLVQHS